MRLATQTVDDTARLAKAHGVNGLEAVADRAGTTSRVEFSKAGPRILRVFNSRYWREVFQAVALERPAAPPRGSLLDRLDLLDGLLWSTDRAKIGFGLLNVRWLSRRRLPPLELRA